MNNNKNIFNAYSVADRKKVDCIVLSKIRTDVRGHLTYLLCCKTEKGRIITTLVNKDQWEQFDVPIQERQINKVDRQAMRKRMLQPGKKLKKPKKKEIRIYNEEIEKWLADHYNLDLNNL